MTNYYTFPAFVCIIYRMYYTMYIYLFILFFLLVVCFLCVYGIESIRIYKRDEYTRLSDKTIYNRLTVMIIFMCRIVWCLFQWLRILLLFPSHFHFQCLFCLLSLYRSLNTLSVQAKIRHCVRCVWCVEFCRCNKCVCLFHCILLSIAHIETQMFYMP